MSTDVGGVYVRPDLEWRQWHGGMLVGVMQLTIFLGVITVMTYKFLQKYPYDKLKYGIIVLWLISIVQTIALTSAVYQNLISSGGILDLVNDSIWGDIIWLFMDNLICCGCQAFFAMRLYRFRPSKWILVLASTLITVEIAFGIYNMIMTFYPGQVADLRWPTVAIYGAQALGDITISTLLIISMRQKQTGFKGTNSAIRFLTRYVVGTGLLTSLSAIFFAVQAGVGGAIWNFCWFSIGPIYLVSMHVNINLRDGIAERLNPRGRTHMSETIDFGGTTAEEPTMDQGFFRSAFPGLRRPCSRLVQTPTSASKLSSKSSEAAYATVPVLSPTETRGRESALTSSGSIQQGRSVGFFEGTTSEGRSPSSLIQMTSLKKTQRSASSRAGQQTRSTASQPTMAKVTVEVHYSVDE